MTGKARNLILIVDDDEAICKTLSAILKAKGYETATATTAKEALLEAERLNPDLALLDIRLPDMEGTSLLSQLQKTHPEMIKIMVTGYPSLKNAVEALNLGAHSYIMKPLDPAELLKTVESKLVLQRQAEQATKERLAKWVSEQTRKRRGSGFKEFLDQTAEQLSAFGLTRTQAKTYATLLTLGVASASEIAGISKVRREEVYRMLPELEKRGLVVRKLKSPRRFAPVKPQVAIQNLVTTKLKTMTGEIDQLTQCQDGLISKLKELELPFPLEDVSVDIITDHNIALVRLAEMTQKAQRQLDIVAHLEELGNAYANRTRELREKLLRTVRIRGIVDSYEPNGLTKEIMQSAEAFGNSIELRNMRKLPFHLLIVDENEAMWGGLQTGNRSFQNFWTNDPTQISILKTSFDNLWKKATRRKTLPQQRSRVTA